MAISNGDEGHTDIQFYYAGHPIGWAIWSHYRVALYEWPNWFFRLVLHFMGWRCERIDESE